MSTPVNPTLFFEFFIVGLILAIIYSLMATGLTLIYSILRVVNFAYGEIYMLGGYAFYFMTTLFGAPPILGLPVAALTGFAASLLLERLLVKDIYNRNIDRPTEYVVLGTFAVTIFLQNFAILLFGPFLKTTPPLVEGKLSLPTFSISYDRIIAMIVALTTLASLYLFIKKTWAGRAWLAVAQNREGAKIIGINVERVGMVSFGVAGALGALAGGVLTPVYGVYPTVGTTPLVIGFVIIVIGGLGSIKGSLIGGVIVGLVQSLISGLAAPVYGEMALWIILLLCLLVRPSGLFGERIREV
jgi:branched-chain amino acid transport system permease protein